MDSAIPKQFMLLAGKPLLMHTIDAFTRACPGIRVIVTLPAKHQDEWHELCKRYQFTNLHMTMPGGETRFHSVKKALEYASPEEMTAVHDGARPLVTRDLILSAFHAAGRYASAVPVIPVSESLRKTEGDRNIPVDRTLYQVVQTPQVFPALILKNAYEQAVGDDYTDDASVVEKLGLGLHLFEGERTNIKITHPHDLAIAEILYRELNGNP
jgi:2-C-methyl-D-erythritol 4-phosphate cytidylyltransferase